MATNINKEAMKGDDFAEIVRFSENGIRIDITDYLVFFTVKRRKTDSDENAIIKITNGIGKDTEHSNPINGETIIVIDSETMSGFGAGNYYYDMQFKDDNGIIKTISYGNFKILQDYTTRTE